MSTHAQNEVDSLLGLIKIAKNDTDKLNIYIKLAYQTDDTKYKELALSLIGKYSRFGNEKQKKYFFKKKIELCDDALYFYNANKMDTVIAKKYEDICSEVYTKLEDTIKLVDYFLYRFRVHYGSGKDQNVYGIKLYQKAVTLSKLSKNKGLLGSCYVEISGKVDEITSIKYAKMALPILKEAKDTNKIWWCLRYIGRSFSIQKNIDSALWYYNQIFLFTKNVNDEMVESRIEDAYNRIANAYRRNGDYEKALKYFKKAKDSDTDGETSYSYYEGVAQVYCDMGKYDSAIVNILKNKRVDSKITALVYFKSKNYKKAKEYITNSDVWRFFEDEDYWHLAYQIDSAMGNYKSALNNYTQFIKIQNQQNEESLNKQLLSNEFNETISKQKEEQVQKDLIANKEKQQQKLILWFVVGSLAVAFLFAVFIFNRFKVTKKQNKLIASQKQEVENQKEIVETQKHLVEEKQKEITDSINYAQRLQQAILPPTKFITKNFPNCFVLYKPKDIVAGDFYWAEQIKDLFFIAAADCTGHGVPGALVSVVCSNALNRAVKEFSLTDTSKILDKTRELVIETFEKSNAEIKDGMDISLLCIDKQNQKIFWSGANNPLWYIQDNILNEIKADKQPVGKSYDSKPFTTNKIDYKTNTSFYLFTDGFADQFGGEKGKKFKYKQFEELLLTINPNSMQEQANIINLKFEDWKGDLEQVDDVCVIGIKI